MINHGLVGGWFRTAGGLVGGFWWGFNGTLGFLMGLLGFLWADGWRMLVVGLIGLLGFLWGFLWAAGCKGFGLVGLWAADWWCNGCLGRVGL